jgi:AraC family transcriptional regulator of adaptative response/methylated-DNA-[protein]-cysteine methyltransferase
MDTAGNKEKNNIFTLHWRPVELETVTPADLSKKADTIQVSWGVIPVQFGYACIGLVDSLICWLSFQDRFKDIVYGSIDQMQATYKGVQLVRSNGFQKSLESISQPESSQAPLKVFLPATPFQSSVWKMLCTIKPGETRSYSQIAEMIGRPTAVRAVAHAIAMNPVSWFIPCHRIIRKDGSYHNYRWGVHRKRQLIAWEKEKATGSM